MAVRCDILNWIDEFITKPNEFYDRHFSPCPFARSAVSAGTVDVIVWRSGPVRDYIRGGAGGLRDSPKLTTRVMAMPPKAQFEWGLGDYVETLNAEFIPGNVFLNTGIAKTTKSRYPGSEDSPYFIAVANSLDTVLKGATLLQKTDYYKNWPREHYQLVVERRARLAGRYGKK